MGADWADRSQVPATRAGVISTIDPTTGEVEATVRVGIGPHGVAVSPDGRFAVVANYRLEQGGSTLSVVDLVYMRLSRTVRLTWSPPSLDGSAPPRTFHRPESVAFAGESQRVLVTCPMENAILIVDIADSKVISVIDTEGKEPAVVLRGARGLTAFVSYAGSGSVGIVDVGRRRIADTFPTGGGATGMALHPVLDELWVANSASNSISVVGLQSLNEVAEFACGAGPARLVITPDGRHCLCTNQEGSSLSVFSCEHFRVVREVTLSPPAEKSDRKAPTKGEDLGESSRLGRGCGPIDLLLSPDGLRVFVSCSRSSYVAEIDTRTWQVARYLETAEGPRGLAWWRCEDDVVSAK